MTRDWMRLASYIKARRTERHMTQVDLARAAGVSEATVQNLEAGKARTRIPTSLPQVEQALGWSPGSGESILAGGEPANLPTVHEASASLRSSAHLTAAAEQGDKGGLPARILRELYGDAPLLDAQVIELPGTAVRFTAVVRGEPDASAEEIRADLEAWEAAIRRLRGLDGDGENGDPSEAPGA